MCLLIMMSVNIRVIIKKAYVCIITIVLNKGPGLHVNKIVEMGFYLDNDYKYLRKYGMYIYVYVCAYVYQG